MAMAQGGRTVKGVVLNDKNIPIAGATITAVNSDASTISGDDGSFTLVAPTYAREIEVTADGYISSRLEIDGSYLMFKLKVDKNYYAAKLKAQEEARIAAEKEAAAKAKAEEEARIAAEKEAAAKAKAEETARIAAEKEAAAKAKAEEAARIAAEREAAAKIKAEEDARIAAEKRAEAERIAKEKAAEQARIAAEKEAAAKVKAEEDARIAAEKRAEAERIAKEKAEIAAANKEKRDALKVKYAKHIKGYESYVNVSYNMMSNNESYAGVDYIGGYRINNNFFLGAGVGANAQIIEPPYNRSGPIVIHESAVLSHGAFYFPVYAHFRAQLLNRRCTPFLALSAGYNISLPDSFDLELTSINYNPSGVFINPQVGVTYRIKPKLGIYCAAGFNASIIPECITNTGYSATIMQNFKYGININIGISF